MNHSFHSADRATHLKIVIVALVAGVTVAAFGIAARSNVDYSQTAQSVQVIKAGSRCGDELGREGDPLVFSRIFSARTVAHGRPFRCAKPLKQSSVDHSDGLDLDEPLRQRERGEHR